MWDTSKQLTGRLKLVMVKVLFPLKENACPVYLAGTFDTICYHF